MIIYIENLVNSFNLLKNYVEDHKDNAELNEIFKTFSESFGYTTDGIHRIK